MIRLDVPYMAQREADWCLPACAQMLLASFGHDCPQAEFAALMTLCGGKPPRRTGFYTVGAAAALQSTSLATTIFLSSWEDLLTRKTPPGPCIRRLIKLGGTVVTRPITYEAIAASLASGCPVITVGGKGKKTHAVLVVGLSSRRVTFHDPYGGPNLTLSRKEFTAVTRDGHRVGIIVARPSWSTAP